jgi:hypothetical protein
MSKNKNIEYFLISMATDNRVENRDIKKIILGKYGTYKKDDKEVVGFRIYKLRVNSMVDEQFYFDLLKSDDFSDTDFKEVNFDELKSEILCSFSTVKKCLFSRGCEDFENYIYEIFTKKQLETLEK